MKKNKKSIGRWIEPIFKKLKDGSINIGDKELANIPKVLLPPEVILKQPTNAEIMKAMQDMGTDINKRLDVIDDRLDTIEKDVSYLKTFHPPQEIK